MTWNGERTDCIYRIVLVFLSAGFVFLLQFKFPFTPIFSEADHLIFLYEGARLTDGEVIYRDYFEFTFPGTQALYAALITVFGRHYLILPVMIVILGISLTLICFEISKLLIDGPVKYIPPLLYLFFGFRWFGLDGSHRMFSPVFIGLGLIILLKGRSVARCAAAGALAAVASFFTQQRGVSFVCAVLICIVIEALAHREKWMRNLRSATALVIGFSITITVLMAYFVFAAGIENVVDATFRFTLNYYSLAPSNSPNVYTEDLAKAAAQPGLSGRLFLAASIFYSVVLPASVLSAGVYLFVTWRRQGGEKLHRAALLTLAAAAFFVTTGAPNQVRLFQVAIPAIVLCCWLASRLTAGRPAELRLTPALMLGLIGLGGVQAVRMQSHWDFKTLDLPSGRIAFNSEDQFKLYATLNELTEPGDIAFQAVQPYVYFPLDLRNPTQMSQIWPTGYTRPEQVDGVVRDLGAARPRYIIWDNSYSKPDAQRGSDDNTGPLARFVEENYAPISETYSIEDRPMQIWVLKQENSK